GQRQLQHFEVIGSAQDELLGLGLAGRAELLVVREGYLQRAAHVAHTGRDGAVVVVFFEAGRAFDVVGRERVAHASLEAAPAGGLVHHHVVIANRVGRAERRTHGGVQVAERERVDIGEVLRRDIGLAAQVEAAERFVIQADGGLAAKQAVALFAFAVAGAEAAFQYEHRRQAVAQVFGATQAPARAALDAVGHADAGLVVATILRAVDIVGANFASLIGDPDVNQAVQGHRRLSVRGAADT